MAKGVIKLEEEKVELALHIIELKKAKMIKENNEKTYEDFKRKIEMLTKEKQEIYKGNQEVIHKVLTQYLEEIKND